jgi:hypothetical protein
MALIDEVFTICQRLAPYWDSYLGNHGLSIKASSAADLKKQLEKTLSVDARVPGFEDYARTLIASDPPKAIEPGSPARSLLYHALASPNVRPSIPEHAFPDPDELETIENYIYARKSLSIDDLQLAARASALAIAVFTKEYRPAPETAHRRHADFCFSRLGIARLGTERELYDRTNRCYQTFVDRKGLHVRALPCRYTAYIAVRLKGDAAAGRPFRFRPDDNTRDFWIPLHKLFKGTECILGLDLSVAFQNHQINEKLRRFHRTLHSLGLDSHHHEPAIGHSPMTVRSNASSMGNSLLIVPPAGPFTEPLTTPRGRRIFFQVPPNPQSENSSLHLLPRPLRSGPEFTHVRDKRTRTGIDDLNHHPNVLEIVRAGDYEALHYRDSCSDGFVRVDCPQLDTLIPSRLAAYCVIAPPDPLPLVKQSAVMEWWENMVPPDVKNNIWSGRPVPLCDARFPANIEIKEARFDPQDTTVAAIVSCDPLMPKGVCRQVKSYATAVSTLPDDAAGVFAPGWDVGLDETVGSFDPQLGVIAPVDHLAAYGLSSPFLEDTKLCAAQSAFWPAAAPDTTRQYGPRLLPSTTPLTDSELGWDNVEPPRLVKSNVVCFSAIDYADYVHTAIAGKFDLQQIGKIDFNQFRARTLTMARVHESLGARDFKTRASWCVFSFRAATIQDINRVGKPTGLIAGQSFYFEMFQPTGVWRGTGRDFNKIYSSFFEMVIVVASQEIVWVKRNGKWEPPFRY